MELRCTRLDPRATLPTRAHDGDAGLDLYALEGATLGAGERDAVGTGIAVEIPEGYAGLVLPRSGLAIRHGITLVNAPGLIDSGYRGELRVLLLNTDREVAFELAPGDRIAQLLVTPFAVADREVAFELAPGDRIAQLLVTPFAVAEPVEAAGLGASARGSGGFGSSGT